MMGVRLGSQDAPTFRAGVDVVQLDVSVLDRDRRPVRGLTAADFTVLEDGKPREIVAFTPVALPPRATPADGTAAWTREIAPDIASNRLEPNGRLVIVALDRSIHSAAQPAARRIAIAAVDALGPNDLAAIVFTTSFVNGGEPQDFTSDRARLTAAIERPFAAAPSEAGALVDPDGHESGDCYCGACVPEGLARMANSVRTVTGRRKILLFIGSAFRIQEAAGLRNPCAGLLKDARTRLIESTRAANLTIHVIDPTGLSTGSSLPRLASLRAPADLTGGRAIVETNAPERFVPEVLDETSSYYVLGFAPADPLARGGRHRMAVRVARPGVQVQARAGYDGRDETTATRVRTPAAALSRAIDTALPLPDVPLSLAAAPFATPGKPTATVALVLGAHATRSDRFQIVTAALDPRARVVASRESTVDVTARATPAGDGRYALLSRLELAPGRYEIRVAAAAATGERGSVFTYVDVPDFAREPLNLSGVVLEVTPAIRTAPPHAFSDLLPVTPSARRELARTDRVTAFLRVYQGSEAIQPVDVRARIIDTADRVVFTDTRTLASVAFGPTRAADYQLELPLATLQPGAHVLAIDATSPTHQARRNVRFVVP